MLVRVRSRLERFGGQRARGAWQAMSVHDDLCVTPACSRAGGRVRNPFKIARPQNSSSDVEMNRQIRNKVPIYLKLGKAVLVRFLLGK